MTEEPLDLETSDALLEQVPAGAEVLTSHRTLGVQRRSAQHAVRISSP